MRTYTVPFSKKEVTGAIDLFEIAPAANKNVEIIGLFINQSSDFGDVQAEILPYRVIRGHATSGSGGEGITPAGTDAIDTAAGFTAEVVNTTIASTGTPIPLHASSFNVAVGEAIWLPEGAGWRCSSTQSRLVVRLETAPADALSMNGTLYVRENT